MAVGVEVAGEDLADLSGASGDDDLHLEGLSVRWDWVREILLPVV